MGFDAGQSVALGSGLSSQFGARAGVGMVGASMDMANRGINASVAGAVMGQVAESGAGKGSEVWTKIMSDGIKQGMGHLDAAFFEQIGKSVADHSVGALGGQGNLAYAAMFSAGLGDKPTTRDLKANSSGVDAFNAREQGNRGASMSAIFAAQALKESRGDKVTQFDITTLAGASIEDLLTQSVKGEDIKKRDPKTGKMVKTGKKYAGVEGLDAIGVEGATARNYLNKKIDQMGYELMGNADHTDLAERMRPLIAKHGNLRKAAVALGGKDKQFNIDFGTMFGGSGGLMPGAGVEVGKGLARVLSTTDPDKLMAYLNGDKKTKSIVTDTKPNSVLVDRMMRDLAQMATEMKNAAKMGIDLFKQTEEVAKKLSDPNISDNAPEVLKIAMGNTSAATDALGSVMTRVGEKLAKEHGLEYIIVEKPDIETQEKASVERGIAHREATRHKL